MSLSKPLKEFAIENAEKDKHRMAQELLKNFVTLKTDIRSMNRKMDEIEQECKIAPVMNKTDFKARLRMLHKNHIPIRRLSKQPKSKDPLSEILIAPDCFNMQFLERNLIGSCTNDISKIEDKNQGKQMRCKNSFSNTSDNSSFPLHNNSMSNPMKNQRNSLKSQRAAGLPSTPMPFKFAFRLEKPQYVAPTPNMTSPSTQGAFKSEYAFFDFNENLTKPRISYANLFQTETADASANSVVKSSSSKVFRFGAHNDSTTCPDAYDTSKPLDFPILSSESEDIAQSEILFGELNSLPNVSKLDGNSDGQYTKREYDPSNPLDCTSTSSDCEFFEISEDIFENCKSQISQSERKYDPSDPLEYTSCSESDSFEDCQVAFGDFNNSECPNVHGNTDITCNTFSKILPLHFNKKYSKRSNEEAWALVRQQYGSKRSTRRTTKAKKKDLESPMAQGKIPETVASQQANSSGTIPTENRFKIKEEPYRTGLNDCLKSSDGSSNSTKEQKMRCKGRRNIQRGTKSNEDAKTASSFKVNPLQRSKKIFFKAKDPIIGEKEIVQSAPADEQKSIEEYNLDALRDFRAPYETFHERLEEQIWSMRLGSLTECHREILLNIERMLLKKREDMGLPRDINANELWNTCSNFEELAEMAEKESDMEKEQP